MIYPLLVKRAVFVWEFSSPYCFPLPAVVLPTYLLTYLLIYLFIYLFI